MGRIRLTEYLQFIYGLLEGRTVYLQPVGRPYGIFAARQKAVQLILRTVSRTYDQFGASFGKQPRWHLGGDFSIYFLTSFMVLLRQLRRLYASGSIFQVPLVYNYSTCCTNRVLTRFDTPSTRLRVWFAYASGTFLKHQLRGEVRQYIDHVAHLNRIDSHHRLKEHTIPYVFRAPRHDSLVLLNQYEPT